MRMWRGLVLLALLQSSVVLAHNNLNNNTDRSVEKKASNSILHKLWKRENPCPLDEFLSGVRCCKMCNPGTYAKSDCTEKHGLPDCKSCTEGRTYMDQRNGYHECHTCLRCDAELGQETQGDCTVQQNTVCKCAKGFFCAENRSVESDGCSQCQHCTPCEHYAEPCTATRDTVCKPLRNHNITYALLGVFTLLSPCFLLWLWCHAKTGRHSQSETQPAPPTDKLEDIDLNDYLLEFLEKMNFETVLYAVRTMRLPEPIIDAIQRDHRDDTKEQKYQLLKVWYERRGSKGAFPELISTLQSNKKQVAEELIQIVKSHRQQS